MNIKDDRTTQHFYDKSYYGKYKEGEKIERRSCRKSPEQKFLEGIMRPKKSEKVLDLGCGTGIILGMLEETGADLWGIDISSNAVEIARKRVSKSEQIICKNADPLPFPDNEFDYVIAWGVIEHFPSIPSILNEIKRVLKKSGSAIIMVPNAYYYKFVWDTMRKGSGPRKLQEIEALYSFGEWKDLIEKSGLFVLKVYRHNKFDKPSLIWLRKILIPFYFSNHFVFVCAK